MAVFDLVCSSLTSVLGAETDRAWAHCEEEDQSVG